MEKMVLPEYFYFRVKPDKHGTRITLEDASDADVVEVVRCKDCLRSALDGWICAVHGKTFPNRFCSDAISSEKENEITERMENKDAGPKG